MTGICILTSDCGQVGTIGFYHLCHQMIKNLSKENFFFFFFKKSKKNVILYSTLSSNKVRHRRSTDLQAAARGRAPERSSGVALFDQNGIYIESISKASTSPSETDFGSISSFLESFKRICERIFRKFLKNL